MASSSQFCPSLNSTKTPKSEECQRKRTKTFCNNAKIMISKQCKFLEHSDTDVGSFYVAEDPPGHGGDSHGSDIMTT